LPDVFVNQALSYKNQYIIPYKSLENGGHIFDFKIAKEFFENIESSEINDGYLEMQLQMQKITSCLLLEYEIKGKVSVQCDRCLDYYSTPLSFQGKAKVVFEEDLSGYDKETDIIYLSPDADELDLTHFIYESIVLNLPVQKIHPDDEKGKSTCNKKMLDLLKNHNAGKKKDTMDPRWEQLLKYKNLN
jgi:uncharacterized protein